MSFLALRTVQDELAKLEAAELIVSRSNGYQRFYRANPKHSLYRPLKEIIRTGAAHLKTNPRPLPQPASAPHAATAHLIFFSFALGRRFD
ncbi:MAG: hypothetical protein H0X73_09950 [Chthoniobacterales bacterium]|nr:hypothetical protein [Chthoniobacterales bacterium]